ncbi:MAG: D-alanyl-D-alanine carboxypeptidase/D-alanyl-D-alanine endopeptidase [Micromonosporaceae bacterium]
MCALVAVTAAGVLAFRPGPVQEWLSGGPTTVPTASPAPPDPVLVGAGSAPIPTTDGISAAIDQLVADRRVGDLAASIVDIETGKQLYGRDSDLPVTPASIAKMATGTAVLATRGPSHRLDTHAVAGAKPGEVVLVGGGDPTLAVNKKKAYRGAARLNALAAQVKQQLGDTKPTRVVVDASVFSGPSAGPGWDSGIENTGYGGHITGLMVNGGRINPKLRAPRSSQPDMAAGREFAKLLGLGAGAVSAGTAPKDAKELGTVSSPPLIRLVEIMISESDNIVAEALARQVALDQEADPSFEGAAEATTEVLTELGLPTQNLRLRDGSGLSPQNRVTASLMTSLLQLAADDKHAELSGIFTGLAVAGYSGTLHDRYSNPRGDGVGVIRAKTGTLNGVSALLGVVVDADGRLLGFSLIANHVPGGLDTAEPVLDKIAVALAGCGCR